MKKVLVGILLIGFVGQNVWALPRRCRQNLIDSAWVERRAAELEWVDFQRTFDFTATEAEHAETVLLFCLAMAENFPPGAHWAAFVDLLLGNTVRQVRLQQSFGFHFVLRRQVLDEIIQRTAWHNSVERELYLRLQDGVTDRHLQRVVNHSRGGIEKYLDLAQRLQSKLGRKVAEWLLDFRMGELREELGVRDWAEVGGSQTRVKLLLELIESVRTRLVAQEDQIGQRYVLAIDHAMAFRSHIRPEAELDQFEKWVGNHTPAIQNDRGPVFWLMAGGVAATVGWILFRGWGLVTQGAFLVEMPPR